MTARKTEAEPAAKSQPQAAGADSGAPLVNLDSAVFSGVTVKLDARLGSVSMTVQDLLALKAGEIVTLDAQLNDLVELHLNGARIGRGEIVAVNDSFGVRIVEIATTP
jgi:flagellar motor switch protein FliN/FliY